MTSKTRTIELCVLGPLEVRAGDAVLPLGTRKQQTALALLTVQAGRVVALEELIDELWPDSPPASAVANVRSYAASLRRLFESVDDQRGRLVRRGSGYQLHADPDEVDLLAFSARCARGRQALHSGEMEAAATDFRDALGYWRGAMLAGLPTGPRLAARSAAAEDERLSITEELADVYLALGQPEEVMRLLHSHVQMHRLRERAYELLMRALYQLGDVAGALSVYTDARAALADELGIEPGRELQELQRSILDRSLESTSPTTQPAARHGPVGTPSRPRPAELPADLVDFVGRAAEAERTVALLSASTTGVPTCAVVGQAGVGKTSLAVHVAHRLRPGYPDGQLFVDLRGADRHPLDPAEVLARFLRALGVPGQAVPHNRHEREVLYRSLLADRRLLVILDNAADEEQVRPLLPGTATCAVLVTSRYRIAGLVGQASVVLDVFGAEHALALLDCAAGAARTHSEPTAARELVRLCDGLPLALRIVGVKLAAAPHRPLSALVDRLAEERRRLDHLSHAGMVVRSSLDFSYERVIQGDQKLLRRVALLDAPDFATWTAAATVDQPVPVVEEGLDRLVTAHLLQATGPDAVGQVRFRLHDLIRLYLRERAMAEESETDRLAAIRRVLHHWLALTIAGEETLYGRSFRAMLGREIVQSGPDEAVRCRVAAAPTVWIEAERAALVSAMRQAAEAGLLAECWRLACVPLKMLERREHRDEAMTVHAIALDAVRRLGDRRGETIVLSSLAGVEVEVGGAWSRARSILEAAEAFFLAEGDVQGLAHCYRDLAYLDRHEGKLHAARDRYTKMAKICHDSDPSGESLALRGLGQIELYAGRPREALPLLQAALEASSRDAGVMPRLLVLQWYAETCLQLGDTGTAEAAFREVASWCQEEGDPAGEVSSLAGLARVALATGEIDKAEGFAAAAHGRSELVPMCVHMGEARFTLAKVRLARGLTHSAKRLAEQVLEDCRSEGRVIYQARTLELLAEIHDALGDAEAAAAARAEAASLRRSTQPA